MAMIDKMPATVICPRCGSQQIQAQRRGFGIGKMIAVLIIGILTFGIGLIVFLIAMALGAGGRNKLTYLCLACGYSNRPKRFRKLA
jgi:ribosomal protein L37E